MQYQYNVNINEPPHEKTNNMGFRPGLTQTDLYSHRSRLAAQNFGCKKERDCTICVAKTKMLISHAVIAEVVQIEHLGKQQCIEISIIIVILALFAAI